MQTAASVYLLYHFFPSYLFTLSKTSGYLARLKLYSCKDGFDWIVVTLSSMQCVRAVAMSKLNKSSSVCKIDKKWVREEKKTFSEYPGVPGIDFFGDEENWLELMQLYGNDLRWLLSIDHHKFWSHMIYSEEAHELLISFLRKSSPIYLKNNLLFRHTKDIQNALSEVEHLVFLVFLRLSTEKESESCFIRNFGEIIYNNYLFTVPVILDICLIYGTSNNELVKTMINNVITAAPDFLDDLQEIIPHFVHVLKIVKEKFSVLFEMEERLDLKLNEIKDLVIYLCDSVATIQIFFDLYSNDCQLFSKGELISKIINFYSNVLPPMLSCLSKKCEPSSENLVLCDLIKNIRIDLLKIVKSIFDFVLNDTNEILERSEKSIYEYLDLVTKLLSEPIFLFDYNLIYPVEYEVKYAVKNCQNVDLLKVNQILEKVALLVNGNEMKIKESITLQGSDSTSVKLNSLITEVKDIFPDLKESFIKQCLNYYNNDTEKVIVAVLENHVPADLDQNGKSGNSEKVLESREKCTNKHETLNEVLDDKEYVSKIKERYMQLSFEADENYDDEYDDTYDENLNISIKEGDEMGRRPFVVPRVLRTEKKNDDYDAVDDNEEEEEKEDFVEDSFGRDYFIENPAVLREQMEQRKLERSTRDVIGRSRGQGQSSQVLRNREFKESHKFLIANHKRKKQASKKMGRGMIPI